MNGPQSPPLRWRYILHADLDAFYASVEQQDDPTLRGRPIVVGGSPEGRGVVAAASYEARKLGARSAMPMKTALRLSPRIVRVSPRFDRYREVSARIMALFRDVTSVLEPLSLDEAYMDVSEAVSPSDVQGVARALKAQVRAETGLAVTIGGATSKTVAKVASQVAKPDGLLLVPPGKESAFLAPLDADLLWGVGPVTLEVLKQNGVATIGDLAAKDDAWLQSVLGRRGLEIRDRARGLDDTPVRSHREVKSVSAETTFAHDISDHGELVRIMASQADDVADHLRARGLRGKTVKLKLRLSDFTTFTRQATLAVPTDDAEAITRAARALLDREVGDGRRFRLIGVGVSNLADGRALPAPTSSAPVQLSLPTEDGPAFIA